MKKKILFDYLYPFCIKIFNCKIYILKIPDIDIIKIICIIYFILLSLHKESIILNIKNN